MHGMKWTEVLQPDCDKVDNLMSKGFTCAMKEKLRTFASHRV